MDKYSAVPPHPDRSNHTRSTGATQGGRSVQPNSNGARQFGRQMPRAGFPNSSMPGRVTATDSTPGYSPGMPYSPHPKLSPVFSAPGRFNSAKKANPLLAKGRTGGAFQPTESGSFGGVAGAGAEANARPSHVGGRRAW